MNLVRLGVARNEALPRRHEIGDCLGERRAFVIADLEAQRAQAICAMFAWLLARVVGGDDDAVTVARRRHDDPMVPRIAIMKALRSVSRKGRRTPPGTCQSLLDQFIKG